jgi:hypothetical protein
MSAKKLIASPIDKSDDSSTIIEILKDNDFLLIEKRVLVEGFKCLLAQSLLIVLPVIFCLLFGFGYLRNAPTRSPQHTPRY